MKNLNLTMVAILIFGSIHGQIRIDENNDIGIRTLTPLHNVHINGETVFTGLFTEPGVNGFLFIDNSAYTRDAEGQIDNSNIITLRTYNDWVGFLGREDRYFGLGWIDHVRYRTLTNTSDRALKENIKPLTKGLEKILQLKPVSYDYIKDMYKSASLPNIPKSLSDQMESSRTGHFGLIAQDVEEIIPELVDYTGKNLALNYVEIIPFLIMAIQEQQETIRKLENKISDGKSNALSIKNSKDRFNDGFIFENRPNPFSDNTFIHYSLPTEVNCENCQIVISKLDGATARTYALNSNTGELEILSSDLGDVKGIYLYSLVVNGEIIESKQLILN